MPYGLFDYGGTINTMGLSPAYTARIAYTDRIPEEGNQMVTRAIPEEAPPQLNTTMMMGEEGNPYTLRMPEEGPINPPSGGTGGCPAGYAPAQASPPSQIYDVPTRVFALPIPAPMPILPTSRPRIGPSISFDPVNQPMLARGFYTG